MRSPAQWYGGKGRMIERIAPLVPEGGRPYCEPYAGGASLFFARAPAPVEVLNDLNEDLVNLYRCLQDPDTFPRLAHMLTWTLYARMEFQRAIEIGRSDERDPVLRAWAMFVRANQGMSGKADTVGDWSRAFVPLRDMAATTGRWTMRIGLLDAWRERLQRVQIDCRDALEVIRYWDTDDTVFYVDPPYHPDTRKSADDYAHEPDHNHHVALVDTLLACRGAATLSGYAHDVYSPLESAGWMRIDFKTACSAAGRVRGSGLRGKGAALAKVPRVETVWINPRAQAMLARSEVLL